MSFAFKTILVPVDFSINTEVAIAKAIAIADEADATLHLLHVLVKNNEGAASALLEQAHKTAALAPHVKVRHWLAESTAIQQCIVAKARELHADAVIIGKRNNHCWLPFLNTVTPAQIATSCGCVFTVRPGALHSTIKSIVVPVTDVLPPGKMEVVQALCKNSRVKVHLVTFVADEFSGKAPASALLKLFQWLKEAVRCPVTYAVLQGNNKAKALLAYAERTEADIVLVNPSLETKIGWMHRHISDVLSPRSRVQVLTVNS